MFNEYEDEEEPNTRYLVLEFYPDKDVYEIEKFYLEHDPPQRVPEPLVRHIIYDVT